MMWSVVLFIVTVTLAVLGYGASAGVLSTSLQLGCWVFFLLFVASMALQGWQRSQRN